MSSKTVTIGLLFLIGALASIGATAHADNINTSGVICRNVLASEALDIGYVSNGVRNFNAAPRRVICSVPRSPLNQALFPLFLVSGTNFSGTTTCTVSVYTDLGNPGPSHSFTRGPGSWTQGVAFSPIEVGAGDYVSVLCTLPGGGNGTLHGITSVQ